MTRKLPQAVFFDLDGTLVDTAPDMGGALNQLLMEHNRAALPLDVIRPHVSTGGRGLVRLGFGTELADRIIDELVQRYLAIYAGALCVHSKLFDGMETVLGELEAAAIPWGVVTNKPGWLSEPLLEQLDLALRSCCLYSGDTLPRRKPHPDPLLAAARDTDVSAQECVYVGDDERDIKAGRAAGMVTVAALYGYIVPGDDPASWDADCSIAAPADLMRVVGASIASDAIAPDTTDS